MPVIFEVTHFLGLVPLILAAVFHAPRAYWWLALALGVSFLADTAAHLVDPWWVSRVYPVSQAALACAVFLSRREALGVLVLLVLAGLAGVFLNGRGPDLFTHTVAWFTAAAVVSDESPQPLKRALVTYFGIGTLAWWVYVMEPGWASWGAYQSTRALGIGLLSYACWKPQPRLRAV